MMISNGTAADYCTGSLFELARRVVLKSVDQVQSASGVAEVRNVAAGALACRFISLNSVFGMIRALNLV